MKFDGFTAPPRRPDGLNVEIPRNEQGHLQPTSWRQLYELWMNALVTGEKVEQQYDL